MCLARLYIMGKDLKGYFLISSLYKHNNQYFARTVDGEHLVYNGCDEEYIQEKFEQVMNILDEIEDSKNKATEQGVKVSEVLSVELKRFGHLIKYSETYNAEITLKDFNLG